MSEDGPRVIALVGAREHVLKSRTFNQLCVGFRHFRKISSDRKLRYMRLFERRFSRVKEMLELVRIAFSVEEVSNIVKASKPVLIIVDDKLFRAIDYEPRIPESAPKPKYMNYLVTIADNLANYFRLILKNNPRKFREELRRFEK